MLWRLRSDIVGKHSLASRICEISGYFILLVLLFPTVLGSVSAWSPVATPSWVNAEIPSDWQVQPEKESEIPDSVILESLSPDRHSRLVYIFQQTDKSMARGEMESFQDQWMDAEGYRICKTHEPQYRTKTDHTELEQVFVQGTDKGAVMYTADYPGLGRYHAALLMEGADAVDMYYKTLPPQIPDHIEMKPGEESEGVMVFSGVKNE